MLGSTILPLMVKSNHLKIQTPEAQIMKWLFQTGIMLLAFSPAYLIVSLVKLYEAALNLFEQGRNFQTVSVLFMNCIISSFLVLLCYIVYGHFFTKKASHQ